MAKAFRSLNNTETEILFYLWKLKMLTTSTVWKTFYPKASPNWVYKILRSLEDERLIELQAIKRKIKVWTLLENGFRLIKPYLPEGTSETFKSESLYHDYLVTALHLGNQTDRIKNDLILFTEMQLRAYPLAFYPEWLPRSERHRPDGYSQIQFGAKSHTVAIEVELSQKADSFYSDISKFYQEQELISRVLWLIGDKASLRSIQKKMIEENPSDGLMHDFVHVNDFLECGWQAPIRLGFEAGQTVASLFCSDESTNTQQVDKIFSLDARKMPHPSATYRQIADDSISNRVTPSTLSSPFHAPPPSSYPMARPQGASLYFLQPNQKPEVPNET